MARLGVQRDAEYVVARRHQPTRIVAPIPRPDKAPTLIQRVVQIPHRPTGQIENHNPQRRGPTHIGQIVLQLGPVVDAVPIGSKNLRLSAHVDQQFTGDGHLHRQIALKRRTQHLRVGIARAQIGRIASHHALPQLALGCGIKHLAAKRGAEAQYCIGKTHPQLRVVRAHGRELKGKGVVGHLYDRKVAAHHRQFVEHRAAEISFQHVAFRRPYLHRAYLFHPERGSDPQAIKTAILAGAELAPHRIGEVRLLAQSRAAGADLGDQYLGKRRWQHIKGKSPDARGRFKVVAKELDHKLEIAPRAWRDDWPARTLCAQVRRGDDTARGIGRRPRAPVAHVVANRRPGAAREFFVVSLAQSHLLPLLLREFIKRLHGVAQIHFLVVENLRDQRLQCLVFDVFGEFPRHPNLVRA